MAVVEDILLAGIAILGVGALYTMKKIKDEIESREIDSYGSFSAPILETRFMNDTPIAEEEAIDAPSLFYRGSVDEPTASKIPDAYVSGGKTKRKRRLRKRSRRKK